MSKHRRAASLAAALSVFMLLSAGIAQAEKTPFEKKGTFGFDYHGSFVTLSYTITYLGESARPGSLTFQIDLEDSKGFSLSQEVKESECVLKDARNDKVAGTVEMVSDSRIRIHFPYDEEFKADGRVKLYTVIRDYKLMKTFREAPSSVAIK
ncbi:MAG: hypothetical protein JXQ83_12755 [Candidatus Glassbacteria bacterium]|nr:hypothetical protein [Candidatus Glassbacteria bacterium]